MLIDLQLHSTYSDGYLTPTELAQFMAKQGVKIASLTDHNTLRGQAEFNRACQKYNIRTIPGLELYVTLNNQRFNILWFNFNDDSELHNILRETQVRRKNKVRRILEKLDNHGFKIDSEKMLDQFNHYVPINHIIDDILKEPLNKKIICRELKNPNPREEDIIREYFNKNKRFHESYLNIRRIIALRKKVGGQLVLNHPGKSGHLGASFLKNLKKIGLDGVEVISPHHSIGATLFAQHLAREFNFIESGGSDFHRFEGGGHLIQCSWQYCKIDSKLLRGIEKIIG